MIFPIEIIEIVSESDYFGIGRRTGWPRPTRCRLRVAEYSGDSIVYCSCINVSDG